MKRVLLVLAGLLLIAAPVTADTTASGLVQGWFSYAANDAENEDDDATQLGFGLKRARIGIKHSEGAFVGNFLMDTAGGKGHILDAFINWQINDMFSLRMGRFVGTGSQAAANTSPVVLDMVDYNLVGTYWSNGTVGADGRTVGAQITAHPAKILALKALLHNGSGDLGADYTPSSAMGPGGVADTGMMPYIDLGASVHLWPGTQAGFTYGMTTEDNRVWNDFNEDGMVDLGEIRADNNMSAHFYLNLGIAYMKFDWANLKFKNADWDDDGDDVSSSGWALTGGYPVTPKIVLVGRYDKWDCDTDMDDDGQANVSFGLNYSFDSQKPFHNRVQATFTSRLDETDRDDSMLFQVMWTYLIM